MVGWIILGCGGGCANRLTTAPCVKGLHKRQSELKSFQWWLQMLFNQSFQKSSLKIALSIRRHLPAILLEEAVVIYSKLN